MNKRYNKLRKVLQVDVDGLEPQCRRPQYFASDGKSYESEFRWLIRGMAIEQYFERSKKGYYKIVRDQKTVEDFYGGYLLIKPKELRIALNRLYIQWLTNICVFDGVRYGGMIVPRPCFERVCGKEAYGRGYDRLRQCIEYCDALDRMMVAINFKLFKNQTEIMDCINKSIENMYSDNTWSILPKRVECETMDGRSGKRVFHHVRFNGHLYIPMEYFTEAAIPYLELIGVISRDITTSLYISVNVITKFFIRLREFEAQCKNLKIMKLNTEYNDCIVKCIS